MSFRFSASCSANPVPANYVTRIKDGLILFQLGPDQVCLADFRKNTIALLAGVQDPSWSLKSPPHN